jgi:hypothetical protein
MFCGLVILSYISKNNCPIYFEVEEAGSIAEVCKFSGNNGTHVTRITLSCNHDNILMIP